MKSKQAKLIVGAILILAQVMLITQAYGLGRFLDVGISDLNDPVLLLFPLVFTMVYALISKHLLGSFLFGLSSWLVFPLALFLMNRTQPSEAVLLIFLALGIFYGLVGAVSSVKMSEIERILSKP
jgi:hypothetical protein